MDTIRIKATLVSIAIVLGLVGYVVYNTVEDTKKDLNTKTQTHRERLQNAYDVTIMEAEKGLSDLSFEMLTDQRIVDAFEMHDRESLYRLALPYLKEAKKAGTAHLAGFIQADGIHFLRLTDPGKFGDNIALKRPMIAEALKTKKRIVSLDVTLYNISLVTLVPIVKNGKFLGVLQSSVKIDRIQQGLDISGIKSALAFDTKTLHELLPDQQLKTYRGYSLISSNDPLFENLPATYDFSEDLRLTYDYKTYIVAARELRTYADKPLARMICALEITEDVRLYKEAIRDIVVASVIVLLLLSIVLHVGFKGLIDRIRMLSEKHAKELEYQLYTDALTGLPNRKALLKEIQKNYYNAVVLLNIDNFKEMNDLYGHEIGDKILIAIAHVLKQIAQENPLKLYKMHADEYALACTEKVDDARFDTMCISILNGLKESYYTIDGVTIFATLSMGGDLCLEAGCDLVGRADMALKTAKAKGVSFVKYQDTLHIKEDYSNNILWSKQLKEAIDGKHFALFYQGVHDVQSKEVYGYEALIRIVDQHNNIVAPGMFLEIAKKSRLYVHITHFVIEEIFKALRSTSNRYSMNLSVDDIMSPETQQIIFEKLEDSKVGNRLTFEILESEGIENFEEVSTFIRKAKKYGCKIAIDDFGSGYSNFAYLMKLDVDYIKIDGSLIRNVDSDPSVQKIVRTIVEFAHRLDLKTVAEFVSSEPIYQQCLGLGIDYVQGYYLSKPDPKI